MNGGDKVILIDDVELDTHELTISFAGMSISAHKVHVTMKEDNKQKFLFIDFEGKTYCLESAVRSFFKGQGKIADKIDTVMRDISIVQKKAEELESRNALYDALESGNLPHLIPPTGLLLKKDEFVVLCDDTANYCKEKTKTEYYGGGGSVRISKNITLRGGKGVPVVREYIAVLDTGRLVLTNKKIIFTGRSKSTTIPLSKIADITTYNDAISLVKEGVQTRPIFSEIDGIAWTLAIQALNNQIE